MTKVAQMISSLDTIENIVGGDHPSYQQSLPFPQCFQQPFIDIG